MIESSDHTPINRFEDSRGLFESEDFVKDTLREKMTVTQKQNTDMNRSEANMKSSEDVRSSPLKRTESEHLELSQSK